MNRRYRVTVPWLSWLCEVLPEVILQEPGWRRIESKTTRRRKDCYQQL